jgi:hypothetical protein
MEEKASAHFARNDNRAGGGGCGSSVWEAMRRVGLNEIGAKGKRMERKE